MSKKIVEKFYSYKIIEKEQEIYEFGVKELLWDLIHIINIFIIGIITAKVISLIIVFGLYCPVRIYAGGYHANTRKGCYIGTMVLSVFMLNVMYVLRSINITTIIIINLLLCVIIFLYSPQEVKNNPLSNNERKSYRKKVFLILTFEFIMTFLLLILGIKNSIYFFSTSVFSVVTMMTLGILKRWKVML